MKRSCDRNSNRNLRQEQEQRCCLLTGLLPCSNLDISQNQLARDGIAHNSTHIGYQSRDCQTDLHTGQLRGDTFSIVVTSFQMTLPYVKLTHQGANQSFTEFLPDHIRLPGKSCSWSSVLLYIVSREGVKFLLIYVLSRKAEVLRGLNRLNCSGFQASATQMLQHAFKSSQGRSGATASPVLAQQCSVQSKVLHGSTPPPTSV